MATSWIFVLAAICLTCGAPVFSQRVIDREECERSGIDCPRDSDPSYKTYCCVENNGGSTLYTCCNPYFGLYVGLGVGIPVIIAIVVIVVVTYCLCVRHHNRKMRALVEAYNARRRREEEERNAESSFTAPPPYTCLEGEEGEGGAEAEPTGGDPELPRYTPVDPYSLPAIPVEGGGEGEQAVREDAVAERVERDSDSLSDEGNGQVSDATPLITEEA